MLPFTPSQLPEGLRDPRVLDALAAVPRQVFVPAEHRARAHEDVALPIAHGQTISQPLVVAWMTAALGVEPGARVLEIGTGSGYQTAVLAALGAEVWTVEVVPELLEAARARLVALDLAAHVHFRVGDGHHGWPGLRDFHGILCAAAPDHLPPELLASLADGGRLVIPIGAQGGPQALERVVRHGDAYTREVLLPVRFVPLVRPPAQG